MSNFFLRPASEADFPEIKALIRQVRINPTRLDWRRFTVAIAGSVLIGCAQLKPVPGNLTELASVAVQPTHRQQGVGRALIENLLEGAPRPIYLTCRSGLGGLYAKFGFQELDVKEMPPYYRRLRHLANVYMGINGRNETLFVMKLG